jgi:hypothetical protein
MLRLRQNSWIPAVVGRRRCAACDIVLKGAGRTGGGASGGGQCLTTRYRHCQDIGREVGLEPAAVAEAATALDMRTLMWPRRRSLGMPIEVGGTVVLPRPMADSERERLVAELRATFGARGLSSYLRCVTRLRSQSVASLPLSLRLPEVKPHKDGATAPRSPPVLHMHPYVRAQTTNSELNAERRLRVGYVPDAVGVRRRECGERLQGVRGWSLQLPKRRPIIAPPHAVEAPR